MLKLFFKHFYKQLIFRLSAANHPLFIGFYKYLYRPSKHSLSDFLNRYSFEGLIVLQIGANDGFDNDPIHKYIKRDKWKGVLLEPQSFVFERFLKKLYAKNKGIVVINTALGYKDGVQPLYKIGFSQARWATGLASFNRNILEQAFTSGYVAQKAQKEGVTIPSDITQHIVTETIQVISFTTLLENYQLTTIDLLQIDTEGFDFEVIKMIDFSRVSPKVIIYEHIHLSDEDDIACQIYLKNKGYNIQVYGANTVAHNTSKYREMLI